MEREFENKKREMKDRHEDNKKNVENDYKLKISMEENRY